MKILQGLFLNGLLSVFLMSTVIGIGKLILSPFEKTRKNENSSLTLATSFATGLAFLTVVIHQLATHKLSFSWFVTSSCILGFSTFVFSIFRANKSQNKKEISLLFVGAILGLWAYLPGLVTLFNNGVILGMTTRGNNDIGYYVAVSQEFFKSGFVNSNHISSIDLNFVAATSHYFSPTALFTLSNGLTGLESWKMAMFVMVSTFSFSWLSLAGMSKSVFAQNTLRKEVNYLVSAITLFSGLTIYVYGNYFLAQIMSIGISALIFTNCYEFFVKKDHSWFQVMQSSILTILSIFTYPHILLPFMIGTIAFTLLISFIKHKTIRNFNLIRFSLGIFLGTLISKDYLHFPKFLFESMTGGGTAGWPLPALNPAQVFFWPQLIGWPTPEFINLLSWSIFFGVIAIITLQVKTEAIYKYVTLIFCFGGSAIIGLYVLIRDQNFDAYTSWKLMSYLLPLFSVLVFSFIGNYAKQGMLVLLVIFGAVSMSPALMWSQAQWSSLSLGVSLDSDMVDLITSKQLADLESLNIDVEPMFETMALSSMISKPKVYPNSSSYFPIGSDPNACTLVRSSSTKFGYKVPVNASYSLASSQSGSCSARKPKLEIGKEYLTNSDSDVDLSDGWSPPEAWGTWSVGNKSSFKLQANLIEKFNYKLVLKTAGFVTAKNKTITVRVKINNAPFQDMVFNLGRQQREDIFELSPPFGFSDNDKIINVEFSIENAKSPQELGLSEDPRKLGFGLLSVAILKG